MATTSFDPAGRLNLVFRKNRDGEKVFVFTDSDENDYDISALTFELRFKKRSSSVTNVLLFTDGDGLSKSGNELTITIDEEQSDLPNDFYWWELYNVTTSETWIYGNAYFVTDTSEPSDTVAVTINLESETVNLIIQNTSAALASSPARGLFDASTTDSYPSSGGSGQGGAIMTGDSWSVSVSGLNNDFGGMVPIRAIYEALVDSPGQTSSNWRIF